MTELLLRDTSLLAVVKSLVQCSKTFELIYDGSFQQARLSDTFKDLVLCGCLQSKTNTYRRLIRVTGLVLRFPLSLQHVEKVDHEIAVSDTATGKEELYITHSDSF